MFSAAQPTVSRMESPHSTARSSLHSASSQTVAVGGMAFPGLDENGEMAEFNYGDSFTYERIFTVGDGDIGSVIDNILEAKGVETSSVSGFVVDATTGQGVSGAKVFVYEPGEEAPWSQWTTDVSWDDTNGDGSFSGLLPKGDWEVLVHQHGRPSGERFALSVRDEDIQRAGNGGSGAAHFTVRDQTGLVVPAKVTLMSKSMDTTRDPMLGDGYVGGDLSRSARMAVPVLSFRLATTLLSQLEAQNTNSTNTSIEANEQSTLI